MQVVLTSQLILKHSPKRNSLSPMIWDDWAVSTCPDSRHYVDRKPLPCLTLNLNQTRFVEPLYIKEQNRRVCVQTLDNGTYYRIHTLLHCVCFTLCTLVYNTFFCNIRSSNYMGHCTKLCIKHPHLVWVFTIASNWWYCESHTEDI